MAKKKVVSDRFKDEWSEKLLGRNAEEQLDLLLPAIRSLESEITNRQPKVEYLKGLAIPMVEEEPNSQYLTSSKRTFGILTFAAKMLSGARAGLVAVRIRRAVAKSLGKEAASKAVSSRRSVSWTVNWKLIEKGGPDLVAKIRRLTGVSPAKLEVRPATKSARSGKDSHRRASRR